MPAVLRSRIPQIQAALPVRVGAALREGTEEIASDAAGRAPVDTGELRDSIEARAGSSGYGIYATWYWFLVEFGTAHAAAHPYMLPAVEAGLDALESRVRAALVKL